VRGAFVMSLCARWRRDGMLSQRFSRQRTSVRGDHVARPEDVRGVAPSPRSLLSDFRDRGSECLGRHRGSGAHWPGGWSGEAGDVSRRCLARDLFRVAGLGLGLSARSGRSTSQIHLWPAVTSQCVQRSAGRSVRSLSTCSWGAPTKLFLRRLKNRPGGASHAALWLRRTCISPPRRLPPFHGPRSYGDGVR
jgi:hypothetical protein